MDTVQNIMEPWDAAQVSRTLNASLENMRRFLISLKEQSPEQNIISSPVQGHVFFVRGDELLCLPSEFVRWGLVDEDAPVEAASVIELDLSVTVQRKLIEAIDEWVSRPVYTASRSNLTVA